MTKVPWSFGVKDSTLYGPVPTGSSMKASDTSLSVGSSFQTWDGRMCPLLPPVNASNQAADGVAKVTTAVRSSLTSISSMASQVDDVIAALSGSVTQRHVNWTSFAVKGSPSFQVTPSFNVKVTVPRSS